MIVFDLICQGNGDVFEGWFRSTADYDEQLAHGLIQCPVCGSSDVGKAPMAPNVPRAQSAGIGDALGALARAQSEMLRDSEWVGDGFARQARAMHLGEIEARKVHGQATRDEARSLAEDGVPVAPLLLPVVPPNQVN